MNFICIDGKIINAEENGLAHDNRSFRYGDGLFETMKMINGSIILSRFHFERLFNSLQVLKYKLPSSFTPVFLENKINQLAAANNCTHLCRIRLTIFRGNGNLYPVPDSLNYLLECFELKPSVNEFNEQGLSIGIYKNAQKSCDALSNIKSANFLPYVMAVMHAQENGWDDCILLNAKGNIADTSVANIFLIKDKKLLTPSLQEGCIDGVMRRYLLQKLKENGYSFSETGITGEDLLNADGIFLTNAINGIRWVKNYTGKEYPSSFARKLYNDFIKTIFS